MNEKAKKLPRKNIKGYPESTNTDTDKMISDIVDRTTQVAVNRTDEVTVMQSMLNDPDFKIAVWDKKKGYVGSESPREEALELAVNTLSGATGMTTVEAYTLAKSYQFTKKDAAHFVNISKDFTSTYLQTGRKLGITNDSRGESMIYMKSTEPKEKTVPDRENPGKTKKIKTSEGVKVVVQNKK